MGGVQNAQFDVIDSVNPAGCIWQKRPFLPHPRSRPEVIRESRVSTLFFGGRLARAPQISGRKEATQ